MCHRQRSAGFSPLQRGNRKATASGTRSVGVEGGFSPLQRGNRKATLPHLFLALDKKVSVPFNGAIEKQPD